MVNDQQKRPLLTHRNTTQPGLSAGFSVFQKDTTQMWKKRRNSSDIWPSHEWHDQLNQLLAAAERAGVTKDAIATACENAAQATRMRAALTVNLSTTPLMYDGHGRPTAK